MMFQDTYRMMNQRLLPGEGLIRSTLERAVSGHAARSRHSFPRRAALAGVIAAACLCAVPAAAAVWDPAYQVFYRIAPSAAQFFQPVRESCTHQDISMAVSAVRVEGDTAQAYITLSGGAVDETTDLFDSWSFHLPFDQNGRCERVDWDEETGTVTFLCTTQTLDGSPIPTGGKMTFSVRQLLTGKEALEDAAVELDLSDCTRETSAAALGEGGDGNFSCTGGSGDESLLESTPVLLPGETLAEPAEGISITAAGYAGGYFHIQICRGDSTQTDHHARLWLEGPEGTKCFSLGSIGFCRIQDDGSRADYTEFLFDVAPEALSRYTLHGDFYTASQLTEGLWQVTFPLVETP